MKNRKMLIAGITLASLITGIGLTLQTNTVDSTNSKDIQITSQQPYSALNLADSTTREVEMNVDEVVQVNLPDDFDTTNLKTNVTDTTIVSMSAVDNKSFKLTGLKEGTATVSVSDLNYDFTLNIEVAKPQSTTKIDISNITLCLTIRNHSSLPTVERTIANYSSLSDVKVESKNANIASVELTPTGKVVVMGQGDGETEVTVSAKDCEPIVIPVKVYDDAKQNVPIELTEESPLKIYKDDRDKVVVIIKNLSKLDQDSIEVKSSDTSVCTAKLETANGITIKAKDEGTATVTITCDNAETKELKVKVYDDKDSDKSSSDEDEDDDVVTKITSIKFEDSGLILDKGESTTLDVTLKPKKVSDKYLKFESDNTSIASVTNTGKVTAKKEGTTTIRAYYSKDDDVYDEIEITVEDKDKVETKDKKDADDKKSSTTKDKGSSDNTSLTKSSTVKDLEYLPYYIPTGKYDLTKLLGIEADRLKSTTLNINDGKNNTNIIIDGEIHNLSIYGVSPTAQANLNFTDLSAEHWSYLSAVSAVSKGYMTSQLGNGNRFEPSAKLTYGETFTALANLLVNKNSYAVKSKRSVVDSYMKNFNTSHKAYMAQKSVMSKMPESEVKRYTEPGDMIFDAGISRIHMANIVYTLTSDLLETTGNTAVYHDVKSTKMLNFMANTGIMLGDTKGNFNPNNQLTRAELAMIITRLDNLIK